MTDFIGPCCFRCLYWHVSDNDQNKGLCRRNPPQVFAVNERPDPGNKGETLYTLVTQFPVMLGSGWCGRFKRNL